LDGCVASYDPIALIVPTWRITDCGIDIFQCNRKVHNEEVKIVNSPVFQLLPTYWLNAIRVVKGLPKLGDEKQFFTLDNIFLKSTGDSLAGFGFIVIIYRCPLYLMLE